jgi:hypothetical protein
MRDGEQGSLEVDVFPSLMQQFAPAHAGIESDHNKVLEMCGRRFQEPMLFVQMEHRALRRSFRNQPQSGERVDLGEPFIDRPIQQMPEDTEISVNRRVGHPC